MLYLLALFIDYTETEKLLTSPSTPSTSSTSVTPPSHLYYSHSWIPHNIEISLEENGEMSVKKISEPKNELMNDTSAQMNVVENGQDDKIVRTLSDNNVEDNNDEDCNNLENCNIISNSEGNETKSTNSEISRNIQKIQYGLSAVVCYVDDKNNEERRNIVTLLRVGPNYHVRSSGNPVSQWYIFNDFW